MSPLLWADHSFFLKNLSLEEANVWYQIKNIFHFRHQGRIGFTELTKTVFFFIFGGVGRKQGGANIF